MNLKFNTKLNKAACFTDIHFGAKQNSHQHNQDNLNYLSWFIDIIKADKEIDHIIFLGDFFENRNAIDVLTLEYASEGARMLDTLDMPIFFIIGNHDLYYKNNRSTFSPTIFQTYKNFYLISELTTVNAANTKFLMSPFLFHEEYGELLNYLDYGVWFGHFEFKGFIVTGYNILMPTGPNHTLFKKQRRIFSGHFHKRQLNENVIYIGNTFPTNFADAGDTNRGCMIYDHNKDEPLFHNWDECPKYVRTSLSELLDKPSEREIILPKLGRVECMVDIPISYGESMYIKEEFVEKYKLRDLILKETPEINDAIVETVANISDSELMDVDSLVLNMLNNIDVKKIDNNKLITEYTSIRAEEYD